MATTDPQDDPPEDVPSNLSAGDGDVQFVLSSFHNSSHSSSWDPMSNFFSNTPSQLCLWRIKKDIIAFYSDPPPGIFILPDETDITLTHCLIIGPSGTPYENGFFYFLVRCPPDYPIQPPKVRLMTTGQESVRFNPNLYRNGMVCLSILGTWSGPHWSAAQCLSSMLLSVQSIMNEEPYYNEPGQNLFRNTGEERSKLYNKTIRYETIRVAVCDMVEGCTSDTRNCPKQFRMIMNNLFLKYYDSYIKTCDENTDVEPGVASENPDHNDQDLMINYKSLRKRLEDLKNKLESSQISGDCQDEAMNSSGDQISDHSYFDYPALLKTYPWLRDVKEDSDVLGNSTKCTNCDSDFDMLDVWDMKDSDDDNEEEPGDCHSETDSKNSKDDNEEPGDCRSEADSKNSGSVK